MSYMQRIVRETPTRFWINNPSKDDLQKAIAEGAFAGTTNPAYGSKLLASEPNYVIPIIDEMLQKTDDDSEAADLIYQKVCKRFMDGFLPAYNTSRGTRGFVTMQDDPRRDHKASLIVAYAERHQKVGANYMAKVAVTPVGMEAMAELFSRNIPVCATECFSIAQAIAMCELYQATCKKSGKRPPFYLTHITGIYDEDLAATVAREKISIDPVILRQAGAIIARKQYWMMKERGYKAVILGGGARGPQHFYEFVGGDFHVTMNWSTIEELNRNEPKTGSRIGYATPKEVIDELNAKVPDFRRAYADDGLKPEEFEPFSPLQRFRNMFIAGCDDVLKAIEARRR